MSHHARLSPSDKKWPKCPGSVRENAQYPDASSKGAIDGTGSHLLLSLCLESVISGIDYKDAIQSFIGKTIGIGHEDNPGGWLVDHARAQRVKICLSYVCSRVQSIQHSNTGGTVTIETETKSNPGIIYGRTDWYGTADVTITVRDSNAKIYIVEIIDYKDGFIFVSEKNNSQLIAYALGKSNDVGNDCIVVMTICQPKTAKSIRSQMMTSQQLRKHGDKLAIAARATDDPNSPLIPGKWCYEWCNHKQNCKALLNREIEELTKMNEKLFKAASEPGTMTEKEISEFLIESETIKVVIDKVKAEAERRIIELNQSIPGWNMVPGNQFKAWKFDDSVIEKKLKAMKLKKDQIFPSKLISPAAALKVESLTDRQRLNLESLYDLVPGDKKLKQVAEQEGTDELFSEVTVEQQSRSLDVDPATTAAHVVRGEAPPADYVPRKVEKIKKMTDKANGATYQSFIDAGWTHDQMIENGYLIEVTYPAGHSGSGLEPQFKGE